MPYAAPRPCRQPGCGAVTNDGYCPAHKRASRKRSDARRGGGTARGYGWRWRKARKAYLAAHPLCVACEAEGRTVAATEVDHIEPHRGDQVLFWRRGNWQALCKSHHSRKTAGEDARRGRGGQFLPASRT